MPLLLGLGSLNSTSRAADEPASATAPAAAATSPSDNEWDFALSEIRVLVRRKSGEIWPFTPPGWCKAPNWGEMAKIPFLVSPNGTFDVLSNNRSILVQRKPGLFEEIYYSEKAPELCWVQCDGTQIWSCSAKPEIRVWSLDGRTIARAGAEQGVPRMDRGAQLSRIGPDEMLAVGSYGPQPHAWCARLVRHGERIETDVFFEAAAHKELKVMQRVSDSPDLTLGFSPYCLYATGDPNAAGNRMWLLERDRGGRYGLKIWPRERRVELHEFELAAFPNSDSRRVYHYLPDDTCLLAFSDDIRCSFPPARRKPSDAPVRRLLHIEDNFFYGRILSYNNALIAPGRSWVRMDPATLQLQAIGELTGNKGIHNRFGVSALLGLITWNGDGRFYQVMRRDVQRRRPHAAMLIRQEDQSVVKQLDALSPLIAAIYRFKAERGLWPMELDELVPNFMRAMPRGRFQYDWKIEGPNVLRIDLSGSKTGEDSARFVYDFDAANEGWFRYVDEIPWPVTGIETPQRSTESPGKAAVAAALLEIDFRVRDHPTDSDQHRAYVSYLAAIGRLDEARNAAVKWITACPGSNRARNALLEIEGQRRTAQGAVAPKVSHAARLSLPYRTFAEWRIFNTPGSDTALQAQFESRLSLPFADGEVEWLIAEYGLMDHARFCYDANQPVLMSKIFEVWERNAKRAGRAVDGSFYRLRAMEHLTRGELDAARADAAWIESRPEVTSMLELDLTRLLEAIHAGDTRFRYEFYELNGDGFEWFVHPQ